MLVADLETLPGVRVHNLTFRDLRGGDAFVFGGAGKLYEYEGHGWFTSLDGDAERSQIAPGSEYERCCVTLFEEE